MIKVKDLEMGKFSWIIPRAYEPPWGKLSETLIRLLTSRTVKIANLFCIKPKSLW